MNHYKNQFGKNLQYALYKTKWDYNLNDYTLVKGIRYASVVQNKYLLDTWYVVYIDQQSIMTLPHHLLVKSFDTVKFIIIVGTSIVKITFKFVQNTSLFVVSCAAAVNGEKKIVILGFVCISYLCFFLCWMSLHLFVQFPVT